jgi:hypothetical protein
MWSQLLTHRLLLSTHTSDCLAAICFVLQSMAVVLLAATMSGLPRVLFKSGPILGQQLIANGGAVQQLGDLHFWFKFDESNF